MPIEVFGNFPSSMTFLRNLIEQLSARPAVWSCAFWAPCFVLLLMLGQWRGRQLPPNLLRWSAGGVGLLTLGLFAWFNFRYLQSPVPFDHMPVQIFDASWYFEQGHPLYHDANSPEIYNILYGPYLYLFTGALEKLLGPSVWAAKLVGGVATMASLGLLGVLLWRRGGAKPAVAIFATGVFACLIVADPLGEYLNRADNFIVLFVVIGAWAAYSPSRIAPLILGAAIGVSINLKVHAFLYFVPLAWIGWRTGYRWKSILAALVTALLVALFPFLAYANISLPNYFETLRIAAHHGLSPAYYLDFLACSLNLTLPFLAVIWLSNRQSPGGTLTALRRNRWFIGLIVFAFLVLLVPGSKNGAGPHHLLPLMVILLLLAFELAKAGLRVEWDSSPTTIGLYAILASWFISCFGVGILFSYQNLSYFKTRTPQAASVVADVDAVLKKYGPDHVILMGVGSSNDYPRTFFRPELVLAGQPIGIEPTALMENAFAGLPTPTLDHLVKMVTHDNPGRKILWLIPKGDAPFTLENYYTQAKDAGNGAPDLLFDTAFRIAFQHDFSLLTSTQFYDLYTN